jgi:hypothetical protein
VTVYAVLAWLHLRAARPRGRRRERYGCHRPLRARSAGAPAARGSGAHARWREQRDGRHGGLGPRFARSWLA